MLGEGIDKDMYVVIDLDRYSSWKQLRKHDMCPNTSMIVSFEHKSVKYFLERFVQHGISYKLQITFYLFII